MFVCFEFILTIFLSRVGFLFFCYCIQLKFLKSMKTKMLASISAIIREIYTSKADIIYHKPAELVNAVNDTMADNDKKFIAVEREKKFGKSSDKVKNRGDDIDIIVSA